MLCGVGAAIACAILVALADKASKTKEKFWHGFAVLFGLPAFVCGLAAFLSIIVAIIRFVKWVWGS